MGVLRPDEHLLMRFIELLEFLRITAHIRMMDLGELLVRRLDPVHVTGGEELFKFEFKEFHALPFLPG